MTKPKMTQKELEELQTRETAFPPDMEIYCTLDSFIDGGIARVIMEPDDGRRLVAEFELADLQSAGIELGDHFMYYRAQDAPQTFKRIVRPRVTEQELEDEARRIETRIARARKDKGHAGRVAEERKDKGPPQVGG